MSNVSYTDHQWSPKDPAEVESLGFDFSRLTPTVSQPDVTIEWISGAPDANAVAMLAGSPTVVGAVVSVLIQGGVAGADYRLRCRVVSGDGCLRILSGVLPVR